jgi:hypothetical protein
VTGKTLLALLFGAAAAAGPTAALVWPDAVKWVFVIGYEIVLFMIGLGGGVLGELKKRWQARAADRLDLALKRRFTRFRKKYRLLMQSSLRFIDLKGVPTVGFFTPDLDDVFVDVSLDYRAPHEVPAGLLAELRSEGGDRRSIGDFLSKKEPVVLAVLGAPGSGKTTLLRHTARHMFEHKRRRRIPVLLYLRDHISGIAIGKSLPDLVHEKLISQNLLEPGGWFDHKLRKGRCVVLLDGLDEVARQEDRRRVADWVEQQIQQYPRNHYVLTSRPHGYRSAPITGSAVLQVRSFTDKQVQRFVRGWYLAVVRRTTNGTEQEVARLAETEADDLLRRLHNAPALDDLTTNPLLLTMVANVHKFRGALPGTRADLYSEICQVMLWRRQEAKNLTSTLSGDKKEALLRGLAFSMMVRRVRDLATQEILDEIKDALRRISRKVTAAEFLADVGSNGMLVERENGLFSFAHHTFQEYLAANHIREKGKADILVANVHDVWWRETTLLYTARSEADDIVKACLANDSVTALSLAFDCAEQDSYLDPSLHEELDNFVAGALAHDADPNRRMLAATVLVTRHLRETIHTTAGTRLCPKPITRKIYHLFRQEVPGHLPDAPGRFEPDDTPVAGVWKKDVTEFISWVNQRTGTEQKYRLPLDQETAEPKVRLALAASPHSVWVTSDDATGSTLWTPPARPDPRAVDTGLLAEQVGEDLRLLVVSQARGPGRGLLFKANRTADLFHQIAFVQGAKDADVASRYGVAFDSALKAAAQNISKPGTQDPWSYEFILNFILSADLERTAPAVDLDDLATENLKVWKNNQETSPKQRQGQPPWITTVAERFYVGANPIFTRQTSISQEAGAAFRIAALCLAAESDRRSRRSAGDSYRLLAAGIALMERRAGGQSPATETIILATD